MEDIKNLIQNILDQVAPPAYMKQAQIEFRLENDPLVKGNICFGFTVLLIKDRSATYNTGTIRVWTVGNILTLSGEAIKIKNERKRNGNHFRQGMCGLSDYDMFDKNAMAQLVVDLRDIFMTDIGRSLRLQAAMRKSNPDEIKNLIDILDGDKTLFNNSSTPGITYSDKAV